MSRARISLWLAGFTLASGVALSHSHTDPVPSFPDLPATNLPAMPNTQAAPAEIPAQERMDSLSLRRQPSRFGFRSSKGGFSVDGRNGWCIVESPGSDILPGRAETSISRAKGVAALRMERLTVQPGGEAALEVQDVWIDATTLGVRVASAVRLPLARLASGPNGFSVYGFRDGRTAHVVVPAAGTMAFRDASGQIGVTTCGHIRLLLTAEPRSGSMALVMGKVSFPSTARAIAKQAALLTTTNPAGTAASPLQAMTAQAPPPPPTETRVVRVGASMSQTSQEREPVFSVALGWEEAESPQPQPPAVSPSMPPAPRPASPQQIDFEGD